MLGALAADTLFKLPAEVRRVIQVADTSVCVILLTDFLVRFRRGVQMGTRPTPICCAI